MTAKKILVLCPTSREREQLPKIGSNCGFEVIFDDFDNDYFDQFLGENPDLECAPLAILDLIDQTVEKYRSAELSGVTSAVGYPGMSAASVIAEKLNLRGPTPEAVMLCEHKYYSRVYQQRLVPEATPDFKLIDPQNPDSINKVTEFPIFLKPVKSCMSKNANTVKNKDELHQLVSTSLLPEQFIAPFNDMIGRYAGFAEHASYLLAEGLLEGVQVSLEGFCFGGKAHVMGIVDAVMFPDTASFKRWQYPSRLPAAVLKRMEETAIKFFEGIGYDNALFNMELFYDEQKDKVSVIEINPKIASQFPNLFEKVDGFSTYQTLLEVAAGQAPHVDKGRGKYKVAGSCVLRIFEDKEVKAIPTKDEIAKVIERFPDTRIQIYAQPGKRLSDQAQDAFSYRYGLIDLGADSEEELEEKFETCKSMLSFEMVPV